MPTLREVQDAFARGVSTPDPGDATRYLAPDTATPSAERVGIYRGTYVGTLIAALRATYPAIDRLVGPAFFDGAVTAFIQAQPPQGAYLNEYGGGFGDFLAGFGPAASLPYLADVARLEWAVSGAANAPDAPVLDAAALAGLGEDAQAALRFRPHPSTHLIRSAYDADSIRQSVIARDDGALAALTPDPTPFWLIVHRQGYDVVMRRMSESEGRATAALLAGKPLGEALVPEDMDVQIAMLAEHLATGRFSGFEIVR